MDLELDAEPHFRSHGIGCSAILENSSSSLLSNNCKKINLDYNFLLCVLFNLPKKARRFENCDGKPVRMIKGFNGNKFERDFSERITIKFFNPSQSLLLFSKSVSAFLKGLKEKEGNYSSSWIFFTGRRNSFFFTRHNFGETRIESSPHPERINIWSYACSAMLVQLCQRPPWGMCL